MEDVEKLRLWAQIFFWVSVLVPIAGAVVGAAGGIARYYLERAERRVVATDYETEIARLQRRTEPRKIRDLPALIDALRAVPPAKFSAYYSTVDTEQKNLGDAIHHAFVSAEWELQGITGPHMPPDTPPGVSIVIRDRPRAAELRSLLIPLLRSHGMAVVEQGENSVSGRPNLAIDEDFVFLIGDRL